MIVLDKFSEMDSFLNPGKFLASIYDNRYKDTNYSIVKGGKYWTICVIKENLGIFSVIGYTTKKRAIKAIESGELKEMVLAQRSLYNEIAEVL